MSNGSKVNSNTYWDTRFADDWEACEGRLQSLFFARLAIENLPSWLIKQIGRQSLSLADWGCALGDGTDVWAQQIDPKQLVGVDFSTVAIEQAKDRYPAIRFVAENWLETVSNDVETYDVVFSSNTLEHFSQPYDVLNVLGERASKAVVLALPYRELDCIGEHFFTFLPENVPLQLSNGFRLVWSRVVDCRKLADTHWCGDQIFLVYANTAWLELLNLSLDDCEVAHEDSSTLAHLNQEVLARDGTIASLNQEVAARQSQITGLHQDVAARVGEITSINQDVAARNEQITMLNQGWAERDSEIAKLHQEVLVRDSQITNLNQEVASRDGQIASLNQDAAARVDEIAGFNREVSARNEQITMLNQGWAERDCQIANLNQELLARDSQIARLLPEVSARDSEINSLKQQAAAKDEEIASLNQGVASRDEQVAGLNQKLASRDSEIASLQQEVTARVEEIASVQREVTAREDALASLRQAIASRDGQIASLNQETTARDDQVANLSEEIAARDRQVANLVEEIDARVGHISKMNEAWAERAVEIAMLNEGWAERDQQVAKLQLESDNLHGSLKKILNSKSWALTHPLRVIERFFRAGHQMNNVHDPLLSVELSQPAPDEQKKELPVVQKMDEARAGEMQPQCCGLIPKLVSVVLPVYNQADLIAESIESVLAQTYTNFELIIVDDGSTDEVETVLHRYLEHPKVRVYKQTNQKLPKALSNGFSFARGEYRTWTSADNLMEPRMLECLVGKLNSRPDLAMVYADYYAIDDRGEILQDKDWRPHNRPDPESGEIRLPHSTTELNVEQDNFIGPCFMYRGWIGKVMGDYDPQLGIEDYDYWMRINSLFTIEHLGTEDILYRYRVHDNSLSGHAHKHRILDKAIRLMDYEKQRCESYKRPLELLADAAGKQWLVSLGFDATRIRAFHGSATFEDLGAEDIYGLVISSETAQQHLGKLASWNLPVAILFDNQDTRQLALQRILNQGNCLAFVRNEQTSERVRLMADCPILDASSYSALSALLAFSKNYRFFNDTRSPQELKRYSPQQVVKPKGRHILIQVDSFTQGGMEHVVIDLSDSLEEAGFRVTILNQGEEGDAATKARECGLRIISKNFKTTNDYAQFLRSEGIDLVNAHYSIYGASNCKALGIPFIETIHNSYVWFDPKNIAAYQEADPYIENYICVSKTSARYSDMVLGLDVKKLLVVRNGINASNIGSSNMVDQRKRLRQKLGVDDHTPVFLNVASIMASKAQLPMVKAFRQVADTHPNALLVLLGNNMEPAYHQSIVEAIDSLGLNSNVVLAGYQRDVASYYSAADVFALPSYWEGWSLSLGEAVSNGLPCVITNVGSAYEFEELENVFSIAPPFGDMTELNYKTLGQYAYGADLDFEARLSRAMILAADSQRHEKNLVLAQQLDCTHAYRAYATLFSDTINATRCGEFADQI